jgi:predicted RNase H-like nuclease (RuvC/YqgF family)
VSDTSPALIVAVFVAVVGPLATYFTIVRRMSGKIGTSEASELWKESNSMREDYRSQISQAAGRTLALEERVAKLEERNNELRDENSQLRSQVTELKATIAGLEKRLASMQDKLDRKEAELEKEKRDERR